ncbi:MAG: hypothetical protein HFF19_10630 [Oscillospiraceae bacterium]|mgnify:FL=1|jgi:hypothetical protein|nr:hypothetical protein [Oscillospiraceae bacterium]
MRRNVLFFLAAVLAASLLAGCSAQGPSAAPSAPSDLGTDATSAAETPRPTPEPTPSPTPTPTPEPTPTPLPWPVYEFGAPLEESEPVEDDSFFDNAVFVGDSRTEGLQLFSGLKNGTFYWARGMSVFRADHEDYKVFEADGEKLTLVGVLARGEYDAVYIMIGVNELGFGAQAYGEGLAELIDKVIAAQPKAVIYLQLLPPVNDAMCRANGLASYINNDNVAAYNEAITQVAADKRVVLLNTAEVYTGEDGQLPRELANDGCHFVYGEYGRWADYLRSHVIDPERYFYSRENA